MKPLKIFSNQTNDASDLEGFDQKTTVLKNISFFKEHEENKVFDSQKDPSYWKNLKRDIEENKGIENPVISFNDGTLIEGHSRIQVLRELIQDGKLPKDYKVPTIFFNGSRDEGRKRLILGNLNRFEIDSNTRTLLFAKIYPEYFAPEEGGAHGEPPTRKAVSDEMGLSESQAKKEKALIQQAKKETGKTLDKITPEDIKKQREKKNEERKKKASQTSQNQSRGISKSKVSVDPKIRIKNLKTEIRVLEIELKQKNEELKKLESKLK